MSCCVRTKPSRTKPPPLLATDPGFARSPCDIPAHLCHALAIVTKAYRFYPAFSYTPASSIMTRSSSATRRTLVLAALALCAGLAVPTQQAGAVVGSGGADTVRAFYSTLLDTMRAGPQLGAQGR